MVAYSVERFHDWNLPLYLLGGMFVVGAICWFFIDPEKPVFAVAPAAS
jgi:hypothetical protein